MCCVISLCQVSACIVPAAGRATLEPWLKVLELSGDAEPRRDVEGRVAAHSVVDSRAGDSIARRPRPRPASAAGRGAPAAAAAGAALGLGGRGGAGRAGAVFGGATGIDGSRPPVIMSPM